jgi:hypothetical protein
MELTFFLQTLINGIQIGFSMFNGFRVNLNIRYHAPD